MTIRARTSSIWWVTVSAANKAKGSKWEADIENYANEEGLKARRLPRAGAKDIGDVAIELRNGQVLVVEAKNVKAANMAEFLRQADVESQNYEDKYGVVSYPLVIVKARNQATSKARVTMEFGELVNLLHGLELS